MKPKLKKTLHTPGPWKTRLTTDWITTRTKSGDEIALFSTYRGTPRFTEEEDIANASLCSAAPEMLQFARDFVLHVGSIPINKQSQFQKEKYKLVLDIIEKAQNTEIPLKTYYYYIPEPPKKQDNGVTFMSLPIFLTEGEVLNPRYHRHRSIKKIEAKNGAEAKEKIMNAKHHTPVRIPAKNK